MFFFCFCKDFMRIPSNMPIMRATGIRMADHFPDREEVGGTSGVKVGIGVSVLVCVGILF